MLDEESQKLTTIVTHKGLFQYKRLPFGISSAPVMFQRLMDQILSGIEGVVYFIDDVLITGATPEEHLKNVEKVLEKLLKCGLKLQKSKCKFFENEVNYLGYIIDKNGTRKDSQKVKAMLEAPRPTNLTQLQSFIGLVNYYRQFIKNFATHMSPLYGLLQKNKKFIWSRECESAFKKIKEKMASSEILTHFDPRLRLKLTVDASQYGLGAILSHILNDRSEKPIAYASRTLTNCEKAYSQIDKEALAIIFGVKKFHQYLYGNKFTLCTDHKPLLSIFGPKKGIPVLAASRMQRYALLLSAYKYDIQYVKSKENTSDFFIAFTFKNKFCT